jgi:RNA polymerase-binding transcription factor
VAKKKVTRKKTTRAGAGKAASKKTSARAGGGKKSGAKKRSTSRGASTAGGKKASSKKAITKKITKKKAVIKKAITKKKTAPKKTTRKHVAKKKTVAKKAATRATAKKKTSKSVSKGGVTKKKVSKKKTGKKKAASAPKVEPPVGPTLTDARAAAAKLAALAGLPTLKKRTIYTEEIEESRPRITKSPYNKRQLDKYRIGLIEKRAQVLGDVTDMEGEALGRNDTELSSLPQHLADQGSDEYDQSLALGLAASQRSLLSEIDDAIKRIDNRTYGICELTGVPIKRERLEATPWARFSVEGARQADSGRYPS